jgi:3-isopropylmalate/(R)-2-methylmalate dehydratase small subunit
LDIADPLAPGLLRAGGERIACEPVPPFLMERVRCGGLLNELKQRLARGTP